MKSISILLAGLLICQAIPNLPLVGADDVMAQQRPMTPTLLRRLAEAVDGNRTGEPIWVIAEQDFPNRVLGVRPARTTALADSVAQWAEESGRPLNIFGPFQAPRDTLTTLIGTAPISTIVEELPPVRPVEGCQHDGTASAMGYVTICPPEMIALDLIRSVSLVYELTNDETITRPIPLYVDAIFFSIAAIDKFVLPYYAGIVGIEEAARMRLLMLRQFAGH